MSAAAGRVPAFAEAESVLRQRFALVAHERFPSMAGAQDQVAARFCVQRDATDWYGPVPTKWRAGASFSGGTIGTAIGPMDLRAAA